eukprot:TRINITY_DN114974_c0_g1_i1.p1 TRINITY_DN114974_c0_g1~~TRINITY_DN114974_c0_g1_i1.p1  ORF type:complete len:167 (+),score=7.60 TRINITY_DN114974_c0_g1_i1:24-503(+)
MPPLFAPVLSALCLAGVVAGIVLVLAFDSQRHQKMHLSGTYILSASAFGLFVVASVNKRYSARNAYDPTSSYGRVLDTRFAYVAIDLLLFVLSLVFGYGGKFYKDRYGALDMSKKLTNPFIEKNPERRTRSRKVLIGMMFHAMGQYLLLWQSIGVAKNL